MHGSVGVVDAIGEQRSSVDAGAGISLPYAICVCDWKTGVTRTFPRSFHKRVQHAVVLALSGFRS